MWGAMGDAGEQLWPPQFPFRPSVSSLGAPTFCLNWETASLGGTKAVLSEQVKTRGSGSQKGAGTGAPWGPFWGRPEDK